MRNAKWNSKILQETNINFTKTKKNQLSWFGLASHERKRCSPHVLSLAEPNCRNVQIENLAELDLECWWLPTGAGPGDLRIVSTH